jgi:hypothetical protein
VTPVLLADLLRWAPELNDSTQLCDHINMFRTESTLFSLSRERMQSGLWIEVTGACLVCR